MSLKHVWTLRFAYLFIALGSVAWYGNPETRATAEATAGWLTTPISLAADRMASEMGFGFATLPDAARWIVIWCLGYLQWFVVVPLIYVRVRNWYLARRPGHGYGGDE